MSEDDSDFEGMGIVRKRRSRRLLTTHTTSSSGRDHSAAASAWGDHLSGNFETPAEISLDLSTADGPKKSSSEPQAAGDQAEAVAAETARPGRVSFVLIVGVALACIGGVIAFVLSR